MMRDPESSGAFRPLLWTIVIAGLFVILMIAENPAPVPLIVQQLACEP